MPLGDAKTSPDIARYIDHTLLKPDATREELIKLCDEARKYGFATVCVNSANVGFCARRLAGSGVKAIAVVGFPLGAMATGSKSYEAREAVRQGAGEIDMVLNIGALKSRDYRFVMRDIEEVVKASQPVPVKVILETSMLDTEQKITACALSKAAGAHFVKTSTGFGGGGATAEDIALMRRVVGFDMGVKASGGVRSREDAERFLMAGADRLGASASIAIVTGSKAGAGKY
jgi:deoxyribose-phosphate aldolase